MKWLWVFLAAIAGALAGATLLQDPGYVMVRAGDLVFESSIAATFLTLLAVLTVVYAANYTARRLLQSLGLLGKWRVSRQQSKTMGAGVEQFWPPLPVIGAMLCKPWMAFRLNLIVSLTMH